MLKIVFSVLTGIVSSVIITYSFYNIEVLDDKTINEDNKEVLILLAIGSFSVGTFMAAYFSNII